MSQSQLSREQEIRVIALEYASKLVDYQAPPDPDGLVANAGTIETYIKGGKDG